MKVNAQNDPLLDPFFQRINFLYEEKERIFTSNAYALLKKKEHEQKGDCLACETYLPDKKAYCDFLTASLCKNTRITDLLSTDFGKETS